MEGTEAFQVEILIPHYQSVEYGNPYRAKVFITDGMPMHKYNIILRLLYVMYIDDRVTFTRPPATRPPATRPPSYNGNLVYIVISCMATVHSGFNSIYVHSYSICVHEVHTYTYVATYIVMLYLTV